MAEGGETTTPYEDPVYDPSGADNDDNYNYLRALNETTPFNPNGASTPAPGGEQIEMHTWQYEQSGLPNISYEETPLLSDFFEPEDKEKMLQDAIDKIKKSKPEANFSKIDPIGFSKKGNKSEIVTFGSRGGESKIFKKDGTLLKSFTDKFSKALGPDAEDIIDQYKVEIQEKRQRLAEAQEQERQANALVAEKEKKEQEIQNLIQQIEKTQAQIDTIQEEHGSNLEIEKELKRLKQLIKNHQTEMKNKKQELVDIEKQIKKKEKAQAEVKKIREDITEIERKKKHPRRKAEQHKTF